MNEERWASIPGWPGYEASNMGNVRSLTRTIATKIGPMVFKGRVLKQCVARDHHPSTVLSRCGVQKAFAVHRLVLLAFVGPPPEGTEACHYNCDWTDNRLENLRWDTRKGNTADSIREGTQIRGEKSVHAKLTASDIIDIRAMGDLGVLQRDICLRFNIAQAQVSRILSRRNWRHLP